MLERHHDQAAGLRRISASRPVQVIAVASGKGGVGKTNISVNTSVALSAMGRNVLLMDADLGLANVDLLLGLQPRYNLSHVISGERTLEEVDLLVVDTAAGISDAVISFTRAAHEVLVVVCDEPASITDAYALMKVLNREYGIVRFRILANMARSAQEGRDLFVKLARVTERFLDVTLDFVGVIPHDEYLRKAVQKQRSVVEAFPRSRAAAAFRLVAQKVSGWPQPQAARGHLEFFLERLIRATSGEGVESLP
jgi:flagellar biosynthesis protein FlhG